jgi:hypothetical protein
MRNMHSLINLTGNGVCPNKVSCLGFGKRVGSATRIFSVFCKFFGHTLLVEQLERIFVNNAN